MVKFGDGWTRMTDLFARLPRNWQQDRYEQMIDAARDRDRFPAYYAACVANYQAALSNHRRRSPASNSAAAA